MSRLVKCPHCKQVIKGKPMKQWKFASYDVARYECVCGEKFNQYDDGFKHFTINR